RARREGRERPAPRASVALPQRGDRAPRPGFDGNASQSERGAVVAGGRVARAEREQLEGLVTELEEADELVQPIDRDLVVERQEQRFVDVGVELSVGGDVDDRERLALERGLERRRLELL